MNSFDPPRDLAPYDSAVALSTVNAKAECIPINKNGHRLDISLRTPTAAANNALKDRTKTKKLCSPFHLTNSCPVELCRYDHAPVSALVQHALRYKLRELPCRYGGACRRKGCFNGHYCFRNRCREEKAGDCRFDSNMHRVDLEMAEWVKPVSGRGNEEEPDTTDRKQGIAERSSSKGLMENWPTMVGNLIDI
jgi:hypothetical protein